MQKLLEKTVVDSNGWIELRYQARSTKRITVRNGSLEESSSALLAGLGVRALVDGVFGFASTTGVSERGVLVAIKAARLSATALLGSRKSGVLGALDSVLVALGIKEVTMNPLDSILAHSGNEFTRDELEALDEDVLTRLAELFDTIDEDADEGDEDDGNEGADEGDEDDEGANEDDEDDGEGDSDEDVPAWAEALTERVEELAGEVGTLSTNAKREAAEIKQEIVGRLAANAACPFDAKALKVFTIEQLETMDSAYKPANYAGRGGTNGSGADELIEMPDLAANSVR